MKIYSLFAGVLCALSVAQASTIFADFNDLRADSRLQTQDGGTGCTARWGEFGAGTEDYGGTGTIVVTDGDLQAPGRTGYRLNQSGSGHAVTGTHTAARNQNRSITPFTGDVIYFSFLVQPSADGRIGIQFGDVGGVKSSSADDPRVIAYGTSLFFGASNTDDVSVTHAFAVGEASLVVGRWDVDVDGTQDQLRLWVNPDLRSGEQGLLMHETPLIDVTSDEIDLGTFDSIGINAYSTGSGDAGLLDMLYLSDEDDAFQQVTGVSPTAIPESGAVGLLLGAGALSIVCLRRRQG